MTDPFASMALPPGTPLQVTEGVDTYPLHAIGTLDPRNAMAEVLMAYLRCAQFMRGGGDAPDKAFVLKRVVPEWPDPTEDTVFPSASLVDAGNVPYEAHALTPTPVDGTHNVFAPNTLMWKTAELAHDFQVDFWCLDNPTREAIAARLPSLFSPGEARAGVLLSGDPRYFRRPVRATLLSSQRMDTQEAVWDRERRLMTLLRCEIDVVQLRNVTELQPHHVLRDGDPENC